MTAMPTWLYRFLRWCPGILGLLLRQRLYPYLLGHCGRGVLIGRHVDLINPGGISLGDQVIVNDGARLDAGSHPGPDTAIDVADGAFIGADTLLDAGPGRLIIGEGSNIGSRCTISAAGDVVLGHHSLLAGYCTIGEVPGCTCGDGRPRSTDDSRAGGQGPGRHRTRVLARPALPGGCRSGDRSRRHCRRPCPGR